MRLHTALIAASVLAAGCVSDHFAPLRADWAGTDLEVIVDGEVVDSVALPYAFEIPDAEGAIQTMSIDAIVDEENMITISTSYEVSANGTVMLEVGCDQTAELTMNDDGTFFAALPEAPLYESDVCGAADTTCTLSDDALGLSCDMMFADATMGTQRVAFELVDLAE